MSFMGISFDKTTVTLAAAMTIIISYLIYVGIYPSVEVPELFKNLVMMAAGFLFGAVPTIVTTNNLLKKNG